MRFSILLLFSLTIADPVPKDIITVHGVTTNVTKCGCDTLQVDLWPKIFAKVLEVDYHYF